MNIRERLKLIYQYLKNRWKSDTPKIHKQIIYISACVFSVSSYVMAALASSSARIPEWFDRIYPVIIIVTSITAGLSKFQKENKEDKDNDKQ